MGNAGSDIIAVNSTDSPQIMEMMYNLGWAANPDYMTAKEAANVTNAQFDTAFGRTTENASLFQMAEPFDGFQYFTGVTQAPYALFRSARITSVVMPDTITSTKNNFLRYYTAFQSCTITLPNVVTIGTWNFAGLKCARLIIGEHVTSIGQFSIRETTIPEIIIQATTPPTLGALRTSALSGFTVYVPDNSVAAYQAADNWKLFANAIKGMSELP